jgi:transcriptional regulator with XRE-family HTH domain
MAEQRNPPGPIGRNVIHNIEQIRQARGLSYDALAVRLAKIGHPINPVSLSRLGRGERRVGVDDLVAFAVALGVPPSALMAPRDAARDDMIELTPGVQQRAWAVWEWLDGRTPLPEEDAADGFDMPQAVIVDFLTTGRPALARNRDHPAIRAAEVLQTRILMFLLGRESTGRVVNQFRRKRSASRPTRCCSPTCTSTARQPCQVRARRSPSIRSARGVPRADVTR